MRKILVATDGSDEANRAIDIGAEYARAINGELSIMTVDRPMSADEEAQFKRTEGDIVDVAGVFAQRALDEAQRRAKAAGIGAPKVERATGEPAQAIIDVAVRDNAAAVVIGRRGRGAISGLLLGSVSQELTRRAPCVVIVVP
jgi:nucleotide-binding universal stress UspA family protein